MPLRYVIERDVGQTQIKGFVGLVHNRHGESHIAPFLLDNGEPAWLEFLGLSDGRPYPVVSGCRPGSLSDRGRNLRAAVCRALRQAA